MGRKLRRSSPLQVFSGSLRAIGRSGRWVSCACFQARIFGGASRLRTGPVREPGFAATPGRVSQRALWLPRCA